MIQAIGTAVTQFLKVKAEAGNDELLIVAQSVILITWTQASSRPPHIFGQVYAYGTDSIILAQPAVDHCCRGGGTSRGSPSRPWKKFSTAVATDVMALKLTQLLRQKHTSTFTFESKLYSVSKKVAPESWNVLQCFHFD